MGDRLGTPGAVGFWSKKKCKFGVHKIIDVCLDVSLWSILLESTVTRSRFEPGSPKAQIGTYNGERELLSKRHGYFSGILGPVAQWIRHLTTNQGIPGSSPGRIGSFDLPKTAVRMSCQGLNFKNAS